MSGPARYTPVEPPRVFEVGAAPIAMADCGRVALAPDEQVTFVTPGGAEYDVARKSWGFYATPSLNRRLPSRGLRPALVVSAAGAAYVLLVERGHEPGFERYLAGEGHRRLAWLDDDAAIAAVDRALGAARPARCLCDSDRLAVAFTYTAPPPGEVRFACTGGDGYRRAVLRCERCGHHVARHDMDTSALYGGDYVTSNYGDDGLRRAFERITALPPSQSDNAGRVARVLAFAETHLAGVHAPALLDVGSGLAVFVHRMAAAGWRCTALDPDPRAARHARETVGVTAICADFASAGDVGRFDAVTFNKVLEHVPDPESMLRRAGAHVAPGGFVYVEVPDGESAALAGPEREEFFVDHWHVFSAASLALLARKAGFRTLALERLREPSGKFTLRAFLDVPDERRPA